MRIVFLVQHFPGPGGAENYVASIASHLTMQQGWSCFVLTYEGQVGQPDSEFPGLGVVRVPVNFRIGQYMPSLALARALLRTKAEIIHVNTYGYFHSDIASIVARMRERTPRIVFTSHGMTGLELSLLGRMGTLRMRTFPERVSTWLRPFYDLSMGRLEVRTADALVAISRRDSDLLEWLGADPCRIHDIRIGVRSIFFSEIEDGVIARERASLGRGEPIVLIVGRADKYKGIEMGLKAFQELLRTHPGARLVIVGPDSRRRSQIRALARALRLLDRIILRGWLSPQELVRIYRASDVLWVTSYAEGCSTVIGEAMASCLPVISTPAGGNPLLVGDAGCGKVVPFGDWRSLSQATDDVLTSPTLRASFCRNGRKFAEHELRDDIIMSKHIKLYDSVCEER